MKKNLYIAIEGLDGTGKSTLFKNLIFRLQKSNISFDILCPTQIVNENSLPEKLYHFHPIIKRINFFRYLIFAYRSYNSTKRVNWSVDLVIGDRCIVVSYVKRWRKFLNSSLLTVFFVNILEPLIPAPDYILFLDAPMEIIQTRLMDKETLEIDENSKELSLMKKAYYEIRNHAHIKRIKNINWIDIDATLSETELADSTFNLILDIIENTAYNK